LGNKTKYGQLIRTTAAHSFFTGFKWKKASEINSCDSILNYEHSDGGEFSHVHSSRQSNVKEAVYNIITAQDFTFIADGCLAHSFTKARVLRQLLWSIFEQWRYFNDKYPGKERQASTHY
jgi:intein/homing endonuclease